jgi:hypothetical protein
MNTCAHIEEVENMVLGVVDASCTTVKEPRPASTAP